MRLIRDCPDGQNLDLLYRKCDGAGWPVGCRWCGDDNGTQSVIQRASCVYSARAPLARRTGGLPSIARPTNCSAQPKQNSPAPIQAAGATSSQPAAPAATA